MNKGMQSFLGFIIFFFMLMPAIGAIIGVGEVSAFNTAKVELTQRVREGGISGDRVGEYITAVDGKFKDLKVEFQDSSGNTITSDSDIDYGDVIILKVSARGKGGYNFKKSKSRRIEEGLPADDDGSPIFKYQNTILMDRRN